jgi:hypothetical protein
LKFIALDVNVGDSFIIKNKDELHIVDGGQNERGILSKIRRNNINYANVVICTHFDLDHLNGIIGIIKSQSIHINELWLPDIYGDIALSLSSKKDLLLEIFNIFNYGINEDIKINSNLGNYYEKEKINKKDIIKCDSYKLFDIRTLEYCYHLLSKCIYLKYNSYLIQSTICKIIKLAIEAVKSGICIRWLKYVDKYQNNRISNLYNLYALNSFETYIEPYNIELLKNALYFLTKINKESLVFVFCPNEKPSVLFTSDSNLSFIDPCIKLKDYSIVTAPHHGSEDNKKAYSKIIGNELIYVRCDRSQQNRPCNEYISLEKKYCTICRNYTRKKQASNFWGQVLFLEFS